MRFWKHFVLIAGMLGLVAMFTPIMQTRTTTRFGAVVFDLSPYQLSFGLDKTHKWLDYNVPAKLAKYVPSAITEAQSDARIAAEASRGTALVCVPALLLLVLGGVSLFQGRFGRGFGAVALLLGILSLVAFFGLRWGIAYGSREAGFKHTVIEPIAAQYLVFVAGLFGVAAGIGGLVKPLERARRRARTPMPPPGPPPPGGAPFYPPVPPPAGPAN